MLKLEFDVDLAMVWGIVFVAVTAFILLLWDVHYFIRTIFVILWGRFFEDKVNPEDTTTVYGWCTTNDLDIMFKHMNNARYIRELDFARFHFYDKTGIYNEIAMANGSILQSACSIKYRRTIPLFMTFKITTKLVYWDEKSLYLEQQFISLKDGFIRAVAFSKQTVVGVNVVEALAKILDKDTSYRATPPPEIEHFVACMDASSARLRRKDD